MLSLQRVQGGFCGLGCLHHKFLNEISACVGGVLKLNVEEAVHSRRRLGQLWLGSQGELWQDSLVRSTCSIRGREIVWETAPLGTGWGQLTGEP